MPLRQSGKIEERREDEQRGMTISKVTKQRCDKKGNYENEINLEENENKFNTGTANTRVEYVKITWPGDKDTYKSNHTGEEMDTGKSKVNGVEDSTGISDTDIPEVNQDAKNKLANVEDTNHNMGIAP